MNPLTAMGLSFGGSLFNGLSSLIGGGQQRDRNNWLFGYASNILKKNPSVLNPDALLSRYRNAQQPLLNKIGTNLDTKFGLDSGAGAGALADRQLGDQMNWYNDMQVQDAQLKNQRMLALLSALSAMNQ